MPIILINANFPHLNDFLSSIEQDVVVMIDEYEKVFDGSIDEDDYGRDKSSGSPTLLSLMDGTLKGSYRKLFILTTNKLWLNENMLNRPGRIRYLKRFGDLNREQIEEIIDDCLKYPEYKEDIIDYIKPLEIITVDIIKAIVSEINIYNEPPIECCEDLNLEFKSNKYSAIIVNEDGTESVMADDINIESYNSFMSPNQTWRRKAIRIAGEDYKYKNAPIPGDPIHELVNYYDESEAPIKVKFHKVTVTHSSFAY